MGSIMKNGIAYGGGGTDVVANPSGTATDTLEKLKVGSTIYDLAGGGSHIVQPPVVDQSVTYTYNRTEQTLQFTTLDTNNTVVTKFPNGLRVFKFSNGQIEKNFPDGTKIVNYNDGTVRNIYNNGNEEIFFNDGTLQKKDKNGVITVEYGDGMKDTIFPNKMKKREYPDGRVEVIKPDGTKESY